MHKSQNKINILFIGDISARPGRRVVKEVLPNIKKKYSIDLVVANAENSAGGRGITREVMSELISYGIDFFTSGEHIWKYKEFVENLYDKNLPLVRPYNYEGKDEIPGKGFDVVDLGEKGRILISNFIGTTFMRSGARNPFWAFDDFYKEIEKANLKDLPILIDFHAEATAEKISFAWYIKDKVSAILGTHTHVPTADVMILPNANSNHKCAFVTDTGMCGVQFASLWVKFGSIIHNSKYPFKKSFQPEMDGPRIFNSVLVKIVGKSAVEIKRIDKIVD